VKYPAVLHRCYKGGIAASLAVASGLSLHHVVGTFSRCVDRFIALSAFSRQQLIADGIPSERIVVKPNFVADPGPPAVGRAEQVVFVGRLASEKGIATLVAAWEGYTGPLRLVVLGDGDQRALVERLARRDPRVTVRGWVPPDEVATEVGRAAALVFPSEWYEAMPLVVLEALAAGTPVVVSDLPNIRDLVDDGHSGLHFRVGDPADLTRVLERLGTMDLARLQIGARARFEARHREGPAMDCLEAVYRSLASGRSVTRQDRASDHQVASDAPSAVPVSVGRSEAAVPDGGSHR
jgi:glycosyltransferase involved in cell wall biosynthesis